MKNLMKLFQLAEITRAQTMYGYALSGIPKQEMSDLAQHHYLVSFMAWQLARLAIRSGGKLDLGRVLEYAMVHDLGELFGGDIAMPYAKANPKAKSLAKAFEEENQRYLSTFFGEDKEYFLHLTEEVMHAESDECLIAKIADYLECAYFKHYMRRLTAGDVTMISRKMTEKAEALNDEQSRTCLLEFIEQWSREMQTDQTPELFEEAKSL